MIDIRRYHYALQHSHTALNPADVTTYYWSGNPEAVTTTDGDKRIYIPLAGTIILVRVFSIQATGTSENSTISLRLNATSDTTISSAVDLSASTFTAVATVSIAVVEGDYVSLKWVTPTWATDPTNVRWDGVILVKV